MFDGFCACGCGERTRLAPKTQTKRGWVKGEPIRYIRGHSGSVSPGPRRPLEYDGEMVRVPLGHGRFAVIDIADADVVAPFRWCPHSQGYAISRDGGGMLHHLIFGDNVLIDHRNGDGLDNRRSNLRAASYSLNASNRQTVDKRSRSGIPGVSETSPGTFRVFIGRLDGTRKYLGTRNDRLAAAQLRASAEIERHGETSPALAKVLAQEITAAALGR